MPFDNEPKQILSAIPGMISIGAICKSLDIYEFHTKKYKSVHYWFHFPISIGCPKKVARVEKIWSLRLIYDYFQ